MHNFFSFRTEDVLNLNETNKIDSAGFGVFLAALRASEGRFTRYFTGGFKNHEGGSTFHDDLLGTNLRGYLLNPLPGKKRDSRRYRGMRGLERRQHDGCGENFACAE